MEKILITGTGRCGTTFLIKLFSFLNFDTGFNRNNYINYIHPNCNAGMETECNEENYILKNPEFIANIENILKNNLIKIKLVIIPIRDFKSSAISRVKHNIWPGGLWGAHDELSQIQYYKEIMSNYIYIMTKYEINTIFINFDKMISDKKYLFNKIKSVLDEKKINFKNFSNVYDEVSLISNGI